MGHLTPKELALRWKMHPLSLARLRVQGKGPRFIKIGRAVRYSIEEIERVERLRRSTVDTVDNPK